MEKLIAKMSQDTVWQKWVTVNSAENAAKSGCISSAPKAGCISVSSAPGRIS
ncbi:hypothetical protein [Streptomyces sp. NBC_01216]|uniref:hypothetical protein n=1 Tax=unclassified Streptomyces TaxID=2593676 RepID=UPI002E121DB4|nr:hypothetical protein OG393_02375 [Streptomyces sp. NBC_01216]